MSVKKICPDGLDGLDVLCNNVDVMCLENSATKDGYSLEVQVNHLSHWLLTFELWDLLEKKASSTGDARVVNHTSSASQVPLTAHHGNEGIPFMTRMFKKGFDSGEQSTEDGTTGILHAR